MRIDPGFRARPHQDALHHALKRFNVVVAHRRFGKTVWCINEIIERALRCELERPRFAYLAPLHRQAKQVAWDYAKHYTARIPGVRVNESELRIDFFGDRRISLYGADNPDALRGIYLDGVVLDEPAQMRPRVWPEIIRPALADRKGWAIFIGTPMGKNDFHRLYDGALNGFMNDAGTERRPRDPDWYAGMFKASQTRVLPPEELAAARGIMTNEQYEQEFECSFTAALIGAYYGQQMAEAESDGRITAVPYDAGSLVETAWDFGVDDATAIWWVQRVGLQWRVLEYYEANDKPLGHYATVVKSKPYHYAGHILPHDAGQRRLGRDSNNTVAKILTELGIEPNRTLPVSQVEGGIEKARQLIRQCWFDADKCTKGLEALRHYRREWDDERKTFKPTPLHDWASHGADAFRYLAIGVKHEYPAVKSWRDDLALPEDEQSWLIG